RVGRLHFPALANWTFLGRRRCSTRISTARSKQPTSVDTTIGRTLTRVKSARPAASFWVRAGFSPARAGFSLARADFSPAPADFLLAPALAVEKLIWQQSSL